MRALALLVAIPVAGLGVAAVELTRVPTGGDPARVLGAWLSLVESAARHFVVPAGLLLVAAGLLYGVERAEGRARRARLVGLAGLGVAQAALAREVLLGYSPFASHLGANVALVLAGALLAGLHVALARAARGSAAAAGLVVALGALALVRLHYLVYVGLYPTLHECALRLAFLGAALGLGLAFACAPRLPTPRLGAAVAAAALALPLVASLVNPAGAWARPMVRAYTELGRGDGVAQALAAHRDALHPTSLPGPRAVRPDPDARARFARRSGLPRIDDVDLGALDLLVVFSDATRFDRTSLARGARGPTPHLAALAARSQVFTRAYAPSNGTFPSVASVLAMAPLSACPVDLRPRHWRGALRPERPTAPEALRDAGRATFWVGHDLEGSISAHGAGLERGFDRRRLVPERRGDPAGADVDTRVAELAIEELARVGDRRFFGWVFFVSPHDDYRVHDRAAPHETPLERYDQELRAMDAQLGRVLARVDLARTVVVFAGDHGEAFGEHGHRHHLSSVYDEQIHVPLVVHVPGLAPAVHDAPVSLTYVLPWLMLRGDGPERAAAEDALRRDLGPWMRALDGAVVSEQIGRRSQAAALVWPDHTAVYDVLADLPRIFSAEDVGQRDDLRERDPALLGRLWPRIRSYRRLRFEGRRFRFIEGPS